MTVAEVVPLTADVSLSGLTGAPTWDTIVGFALVSGFSVYQIVGCIFAKLVLFAATRSGQVRPYPVQYGLLAFQS
jgi:hypothetical protein